MQAHQGTQDTTRKGKVMAATKKVAVKKRKPTQKRAPKAAKSTVWVLRNKDGSYLRDEVALFDHKEDLMFELQLNVDDYGDGHLSGLEVLECQIVKRHTPAAEKTIVLI